MKCDVCNQESYEFETIVTDPIAKILVCPKCYQNEKTEDKLLANATDLKSDA